MSKEERKVPELRFKGFHDDWEQRTLSQELSLLKDGTHGTHKNVTNGLYLLSAKNIKNGEIIITEQERQISREEFNKIHRNFVLHSGDVLLTVVGSIGETAILTKPKDVTFQRSVAYLRPSQMNSQFLYNLIQTVGFQNELKKKQVVSAQPGVYLGDLKKISIKMTKNATEQIKISQFTQLIDKIITLHQRKIITLETLRKVYLNVMFPNNNETTPRLRFNSFKKEWEQRKLGDFISIKSGWSPSNFKEIKETNANLYIKVDDLNYSSREQMNSKLKVEDNSRFIKIKKYSTIFPKRGAAIMTNKVRYLKHDAYMDTNMMALEPLKINDLFLYTFIEKEGLFRIADTSTIPQINNGHINPYPINLPNGTEQNIIGIMFESIDKIIELHQKKVNNLNKLKKLYLRKMFL